jgi:hypothetical protein
MTDAKPPHVCPIAPVIPLTARTRTRLENRRRYA